MTSNIDVTVPRSGNADTARVRANFATIKSEVQDLQSRLAGLTARLDAGMEMPEDAVRLAQLAQVALSGSYYHLAHRPHIPAGAEDLGALPLAGGAMTGPLALSRNAGTAMEPVPLQQLQGMLAALAEVARTGRYADLLDRPALGTAASRDAGAFASAAQGARADTAVQPQDLAPVATSGSFADLDGAVTEAQLAPAVAAKLNNTLPYNISATRPPGAADDVGGGWLVGSLWVDVQADEAYRCVDAASGAAKWVKTTVDATELAALAFSGQFADLGGRPTTLAGYGITDAAPMSHTGAGGAAHAAATASTAGFLSAADKAKLDGIAAGAQVNTVASVNAKTGAVVLAHTDVGAAPAVHAHGEATASAAGFLSAADKAKLDGIAAGANAYVHPASGVSAGTYRSVTVDGSGHVTGGGNPTTLAGYGITDAAPAGHVGAGGAAHANATTGAAGFLSAADKTKLDGIAAGANAYAHPASGVATGTYRSVTVDGNGHVTGGTNPTTLAGYGITDAAPLSHAGAGGAAHAAATASTAGFLSAADKAKLDGIAAGANAYLHPASGVAAGTYRSVTVDGNGHVTGGTNPTTLAGYGITDAAPVGHVGSGGGAHAVATQSTAGFLSASDKAKLDGMTPATAATAGTLAQRDANNNLASGSFIASAAFPLFEFHETDGAANNRRWQQLVNGQQMIWRTLTDDGSADTPWLTVSRSGVGVSSIAFGGSLTVGVQDGLILSRSAGNHRLLNWRSGTSNRWHLGADSGTEGGSNAGSAFVLMRYSDAGAYLGTPISVSRAGGLVSFETTPAVAGNYVWHAGNLGNATTATAGLMSAADKTKLNALGSVASGVLPPVNQAPAAGALGTTKTPTLQGSAFATVGSADTHAASQWQIATDAAFTTIVYDSGEVTT
ncbi:hypothetical protein [Azospirillum sp.]|uniref:hypothetical protein n=1 Tax=Azospirillum sp. TaxID=34012 RepID=UPI002D538C8C|nr:hypothetical protein [Azospirillum sp.]HYD67000.1 hypothetical protein [Azospirillum sp.]